jgi:hypothetical protein
MDAITKKKLVLVKLLFQQAEKQSQNISNIPNRFMAIIGFDLTIETLIKTILINYFKKKVTKLPSELEKLFDDCDIELKANSLSLLPLRRELLLMRNIRNSAQHDARDPNSTEVNDGRTYTRDFCQQVIANIWNVSFNALTLIDLVIDPLLQKLLSESLHAISNGDIKKGLCYIDFVFYIAHLCFLEILPKNNYQIYQTQIPEISNKSADYLSSSLSNVERRANLYATLLSSGLNVVDFTNLKNNIPETHFTFSSTSENPSKHNVAVQVHWQSIDPDLETALWANYFVTDLIVQWQMMGLNPRCNKVDDIEEANILLSWDIGNQIKFF